MLQQDLRPILPSMALVLHRSAVRPLFRFRRRVQHFSVFTCPVCGKRSRDQMPTDASVCRYRCTKCNAMITPIPGRCCIYCSYGDRRCPYRQRMWWW